jgi:hypothetical protein
MGSTKNVEHGIESAVGELSDWRSKALGAVSSHEAVKKHGFGIDTGDLANFVEMIAGLAAERVRGIGAEQYAHEKQDFEDKSIDEIITDLLEEVFDIIAYASFLAVKAGALR